MPGDVRLRCDEDACRVKERISFKGGGYREAALRSGRAATIDTTQF